VLAEQIHASVGSSLGGMQSLAAAAMYPDRVGRFVSISACARSHPSSIAIRYAQRHAIVTDPDWQNGHYYGTGKRPFLLALWPSLKGLNIVLWRTLLSDLLS
jgi:homoserine O-acetyltransferase